MNVARIDHFADALAACCGGKLYRTREPNRHGNRKIAEVARHGSCFPGLASRAATGLYLALDAVCAKAVGQHPYYVSAGVAPHVEPCWCIFRIDFNFRDMGLCIESTYP